MVRRATRTCCNNERTTQKLASVGPFMRARKLLKLCARSGTRVPDGVTCTCVCGNRGSCILPSVRIHSSAPLFNSCGDGKSAFSGSPGIASCRLVSNFRSKWLPTIIASVNTLVTARQCRKYTSNPTNAFRHRCLILHNKLELERFSKKKKNRHVPKTQA